MKHIVVLQRKRICPNFLPGLFVNHAGTIFGTLYGTKYSVADKPATEYFFNSEVILIVRFTRECIHELVHLFPNAFINQLCIVGGHSCVSVSKHL